MAKADFTLEMSEDLTKAFNELLEEVKKAQLALSESRIRELIREELATWEKRQLQVHRFGTPINHEVKEDK